MMMIPAQCEFYCIYTTYLPAFHTNFERALSPKLGFILMSICKYLVVVGERVAS